MYIMYTRLTNWKTPLLYCHCESCFLSYIVPCHVYAKLKQHSYATHCMIYLALWFMLHMLYSWNYYMYNNTCPVLETPYCLLMNETNCEQYYTTIDMQPYKCVFQSDVNLCLYDSYSCIETSTYTKINLFVFLMTSMIYVSIWILNLRVRKEIQEKKEIEYDSHSCLATSCCSTCGLAQEYREIV